MDWKSVIFKAQAEHGLTQVQIAERVGCTQTCISDLYRGKTADPLYTVGAKLIQLTKSKRRRLSVSASTAPTKTTTDAKCLK